MSHVNACQRQADAHALRTCSPRRSVHASSKFRQRSAVRKVATGRSLARHATRRPTARRRPGRKTQCARRVCALLHSDRLTRPSPTVGRISNQPLLGHPGRHQPRALAHGPAACRPGALLRRRLAAAAAPPRSGARPGACGCGEGRRSRGRLRTRGRSLPQRCDILQPPGVRGRPSAPARPTFRARQPPTANS